MNTIFKDPAIQATFERQGFVQVPLLEQPRLQEIQQFHKAFHTAQTDPTHKTNYDINTVTGHEQAWLIRHLNEDFSRLLHNRSCYMALFYSKEPDTFIVWPHQDWSSTTETEDPSLWCWIPLQDTDESNGGLGFIKGSHQYFDYLRAIPYETCTPVKKYRTELTPYLDILQTPAGHAIIFDTKTIHGSMQNLTKNTRHAIITGLAPTKAPLYYYFLKPNGKHDTLLSYKASTEFYARYDIQTAYKMYLNGEIIEEPFEEIACKIPSLSWEQMEALVKESGNTRNEAFAEQAQKVIHRASHA